MIDTSKGLIVNPRFDCQLVTRW